MIYRLNGTPNQQQLVSTALQNCDFPWERLRPKLGQVVGRDYIPVYWADLSRYATSEFSVHSHIHDHKSGADGHVLKMRGAAMGLAWTNGRIELDYSCEKDPLIGGAVFLAEAAHMVDFFYLTDLQRQELFSLFHDGDATPHSGHGWWEEQGNEDYWTLSGETFMGAFVSAFSGSYERVNFGPFIHTVRAEKREQVRGIVLGTPPVITPPPPLPVARFFATKTGRTFHEKHAQYKPHSWFVSCAEARGKGFRECKVCKPRCEE